MVIANVVIRYLYLYFVNECATVIFDPIYNIGSKITTIECYSSNNFEVMKMTFILLNTLFRLLFYADIMTNILRLL